MGDFFAKYKTILYALIAVFVLGGGWYMFSGGGGQSTTLLSTQNLDESGVDKDLVGTLLQLRAVTLSGVILNDPGFLSLRDFGSDIIPEPVGRPNPFAPISATSSAQAKKIPSPAAALFPNQ